MATMANGRLSLTFSSEDQTCYKSCDWQAKSIDGINKNSTGGGDVTRVVVKPHKPHSDLKQTI